MVTKKSRLSETVLLQLIARGEDSRQQFKRDATNADGVAAELAAFANSGGGVLMLGVADDGTVTGLDAAAVRRLNQLLSNAASQHVRPPVHPVTENVETAHGLVIVATVPDGLGKPYVDLQGRIWVKQGADKRHVTAREELQRMFQRAGLVYADVVPVAGTTAADLDEKTFRAYVERRYGSVGELNGLPLDAMLQNLGLGDGRELNLAGLMLFGRQPQRWRPAFAVKAVAFPGTSLADTRYLDSEDIDGTLLEQFKRSFAFIRRNLHHVQRGRGFNTLGELEIPEAALEELLVNALGPTNALQGVAKLTTARPSRRATTCVRPHARGVQRRGAGCGELPFGLSRKGTVCGVARTCKARALLRACALHPAPLRGNAIPLQSVGRP